MLCFIQLININIHYKTYISILGEKIGSEPTLPYLSPKLTGQKLLVGANFASAGIGILNDTGIQFVSPKPT